MVVQVKGQAMDIESVVTTTAGASPWDATGTTIWIKSGDEFKQLETREDKMRNSGRKWEFNALHTELIYFDLIARELDGATPIALVDYGEKDHYVVVDTPLILKARIIEAENTPEFISRIVQEEYVVFKIPGSFKDWIDWAGKVKAAPWPDTGRKHNTVVVSLPKV